jgi:hypothetical protein
VLLLLLATTVAFGQTDRGSIRGTVFDPSGAVVPGASVTVTNTATGVAAAAISTGAGTYNVPALQSGTYNIEVKQAGFKNLVRENITVSAGNVTGLDLTLALGNTAETVVVTAEAPLLQTETASTGTSVDNRAYVDLPLSSGGGRRSNGYLTLVPGYAGSPGGFTDSINGAQASTKEIQLEGASMVTQEISGDGRNVTFPPDAVQEMSVATSGYSAEYGNTGGGVERYVLKSGTNQLHGSAYEFLRNEAFDARGYFNAVRPIHREHEYGGTIGGPIMIPKVYDGRNKSFFFFSYNGYKFRSANSTQIISVPTQAFRNGNFSSVLTSNKLYDPATTRPDPLNPGKFIRDPFPGNIIPANRISPVALNILSYMPLPNQAGNFNNFAATVPASPNDRKTFSIKGDHYFTESQHITVSLVTTSNPSFNASALPDPVGGQQDSLFTYWFPRITYDWTIRPNMLNQFRIGYNRQTQRQAHPSENGGWPVKLGLTGMDLSPSAFPRISWGSFTGTAASLGFNDRFANTYTISDGLSWTVGAHNMKFGFETRMQETNKYLANAANLTFSRNETADPNNLSKTGLEFASFLLGQVDSAGQSIYGDFAPKQRSWQMGFYGQDDFKITPRLTVNYGMRLDVYLPLAEKHDWYSMADLTTPNPAAGNLPGVYLFAGQNGLGDRIPPADHDALGWGPRVGFAYKLTDNMVIRSGYGISYSQTGAYGGGNNVNQNDAYWPTSTSQPVDQFTPAYTFATGFPAKDLIIPPQLTPTLGVGTGFVNYWTPLADRIMYSQNWNLNLQRQLGRDMSIDIGYVGAKGTRLPIRTDLNQLDPKYFALGSTLLNKKITDPAVPASIHVPYAGFTGTVAQALRPYPQFVNMFPGGRNSDTTGNSTYHSLQAMFQKRFSGGLYATAAYTWSKALTDAPNNYVQNAPVAPNIYYRDLGKTYPSSWRPHSLAVSFNYELPFGPGKPLAGNGGILGKVIGGWQLNGILRYQSGPPLSVSIPQTLPLYTGGATAEGVGGSTAIPRYALVVPGVDQKGFSGSFNARTDRWVNAAAFTLPADVPAGANTVDPVTFLGGRQYVNSFRGPALYNEDMGLMKKNKLSEKVSLDFRIEAFNVFNRTQFNSPATDLGTPSTFGKITRAGSARNGQIALKLTF